jgi:AcrR family transcriptional regulator
MSYHQGHLTVGSWADGRDSERAVRSSTGSETRHQLVRAAEQLFAARGIDGVSLREINRLAGQANKGAVQYHFGDRDGLVQAVMDKHRRDTEPRRHALLDHYEESGLDDLRALATALVLPLAAKLSDPDGGREYLQIACEFTARPDLLEQLGPERDPHASMVRWHRLLDPLLPREPATSLGARFAAIRFAVTELARRSSRPARGDDRLFVSHLIDLVTAVLAAPPSDRTSRLLPTPSRDGSTA